MHVWAGRKNSHAPHRRWVIAVNLQQDFVHRPHRRSCNAGQDTKLGPNNLPPNKAQAKCSMLMPKTTLPPRNPKYESSTHGSRKPATWPMKECADRRRFWVSGHMGLKTLHQRRGDSQRELPRLAARVVTPTTLRDFGIEGAAELGECTGAQSFRATRHDDGQPVLLHKFRPAQSLIDLGPLVTREKPPDFTKPFVTQFTDLFVVAGSAYLVEPLPPCFALSDLWRYVLQRRSDQAYTVITIVVRQLAVHPRPTHASEPLSRGTAPGEHRAGAYRQFRNPGRTPPLPRTAGSGFAKTPRLP